MSYGYFQIGNKKSLDFGLLISDELSFSSPEIRGNFVTIEGQDGEVYLTNGNIKNLQKSFQVYLDSSEDIQNQVTRISNWLKGNAEWQLLTFSGDPEYRYVCIFVDEYDIDATLGELGKGVLTFQVKPYKFLKTGLQTTTLGSVVTNPTNRNARPRLKITGTGTISIQIGRERLALQNMDGGIIVDSLYTTVTNLSETKSLWNKVISYPLPVIRPGRQSIYTTGNVTKIEIIPRWEVLV